MLPSGVPYDTLFESVRYMAGRVLTDKEAVRLAWRLAGNLPALVAGQSVPPWAMQRSDEWVPLQVMRIHRTRNAKGKTGIMLTARVLAGTPAPLAVSTFWGLPVAKYVASKIGFSKPWRQYAYSNPEDIVGLRFYGLIEAARSREKPEFHEVECPASVQKWNRDHVLKLRLRVGLKCPAEFDHKCSQCPYGYDRCDAGTHPKTYTIGNCANCGKIDTLFDPDEIASTYCLTCANAARMQRM